MSDRSCSKPFARSQRTLSRASTAGGRDGQADERPTVIALAPLPSVPRPPSVASPLSPLSPLLLGLNAWSTNGRRVIDAGRRRGRCVAVAVAACAVRWACAVCSALLSVCSCAYPSRFRCVCVRCCCCCCWCCECVSVCVRVVWGCGRFGSLRQWRLAAAGWLQLSKAKKKKKKRERAPLAAPRPPCGPSGVCLRLRAPPATTSTQKQRESTHTDKGETTQPMGTREGTGIASVMALHSPPAGHASPKSRARRDIQKCGGQGERSVVNNSNKGGNDADSMSEIARMRRCERERRTMKATPRAEVGGKERRVKHGHPAAPLAWTEARAGCSTNSTREANLG